MAIDILQLVKFHVKPALTVDTTLEGELPFLIDTQIAQQGYTLPLTDKQACYVAALTLEAMLPRLALIYTDEIQEHRGGPEGIRLPDRAGFFKALQKAIQQLKETTGENLGILPAINEEVGLRWPGIGIAAW